MLISRTSQYAIQAMIYIATKPAGSSVLCREAAETLQVPAPYLSKIMQKLCTGGLVDSFRGRLGGFQLREAAANIDLMRILLLTEGPEFKHGCVLGLKTCSDQTACPMHKTWSPIKEKIFQLLHQQNLAVLSEAVMSGKYRISDIPFVLMPAD